MKIMITVVVALKSTCCLKHWHRAQRSQEAYCRGTGLGGESGWSRNTWNWRMLQVKRTSVLCLQRTNSVNILLLIDIFFLCYYFWAVNFSFCLHIYLYPHILQANCYFHTLAKWLSCRVLKCCAWGRGAEFDTWVFVLNKEMCRLHVFVLYLQKRMKTLFFFLLSSVFTVYEMWLGSIFFMYLKREIAGETEKT